MQIFGSRCIVDRLSWGITRRQRYFSIGLAS